MKPNEEGDENECIDDHVESIIKVKSKKIKRGLIYLKKQRLVKIANQKGKYIVFTNNIYNSHLRMLFGQWQDDNDRQKRAIKSKMYKEMLDNQILINERYKKQKDGGRQYSDTSQITQKRYTSNVDHKRYDTSGIQHDGESNNKKHKYVNLPVLKDRNTYLKGQSKFVVVEPAVPTKPAKKHFKTELIEEDQDDLDEYNSTCQKIIRQLQSINKQTPKMKYRRKLYEYSDLAPNRKRYEKLKVEELKRSQAEVYNDFSKSANKMDQSPNDNWSTKAKIGSEDRVPSFSMVGSSKEGTLKPKSLKTNLTNIQPIKKNIENRKEKVEESTINQFQEVRQTQKSDRSPQVAKEGNQISASSSSKAINLERSRMKSNVQITKAHPIITQNDKIPQQTADNMKVHKENFLALLRKVKNRGQSLFIKLSGFPKQENKGYK